MMELFEKHLKLRKDGGMGDGRNNPLYIVFDHSAATEAEVTAQAA